VLKSKLFIIIINLVVASFASSVELYAQENVFLHPKKFYKKFFPGLKVKRNPPDSLYVKSYPNYLSVGVHVLLPAVDLNVSSRSNRTLSSEHTSKLRTTQADIVGLSVSYRFVTAGFAFLVKPAMQNNYAPSRYRTATIKYNSAAYSLQFKYIRWRGFTDINTANSISLNEYVKRPNMISKEFQFEGIYNFGWKKYSYLAPITFSQRQVKSHAGILLKAGVYYNQLSDDSILITHQQQPYFDGLDNVKAIRTLSIKLAPGVGGNLVFLRTIYLSVAVFASTDLYFYSYLKNVDETTTKRRAIVYVLDGKASLGYQSKRVYGGLRFEVENRRASLHSIKMNTLYSYIGIELGYRFVAPHIVKKVYKDTMPPGM
jgi:hypothetical protein